MPLTSQNIESELSYAYLHAVASKAGMSCKVGGRHDDNSGVDAIVNYFGPIPNTYISDVQIDIQLKATINDGGSYPDHFSYFIQKIERYDKLRTNDSTRVKLLAVLFLPPDANNWLNCSVDQLILQKAAYWVCLYGAPPSSNSSGQTIYLPRANFISPESLQNLAIQIGQNIIPVYQMP